MLRLHTSEAALADISRECTKVTLPLAKIGIYDCDWMRPMRCSAQLSNHLLYLSLTPQPRATQLSRSWLDGRFGDVQNAGLFPAGQEIHARSEGGRQRVLLCRIDPARFDDVLGTSIDWDAPTRLAAMELRDVAIRGTLARIAHEALNPGMASAALMEALCISLVVDVGRHLDARQHRRQLKTGQLAPWQMRRIEERVRSAAGRMPTLDEAASLCGISTRQLVRGFKASTGRTVHEYFSAQQMEYARGLLSATDLPMKAIAIQFGFRQQGSFTAAFRRACGETPSAYRLRTRR
jgi:AraC family transcriptional regulator